MSTIIYEIKLCPKCGTKPTIVTKDNIYQYCPKCKRATFMPEYSDDESDESDESKT